MSFEVYVLTKQHLYQEEEVFVEVFGELPSIQQLSNVGVPTARTNHVQKGGGQIAHDLTWFYLRKQTLTTSEDKIYDRMKQSDSGA